jgi:hypothetical protein
MWQRWFNWAAIVLVGGFSLVWLGVVIYVNDSSTFWMRAFQLAFGVALAAWTVRKTTLMITKA